MRLYNWKVGGLKVCQQRLVAVQLRAVIALIVSFSTMSEMDRIVPSNFKLVKVAGLTRSLESNHYLGFKERSTNFSVLFTFTHNHNMSTNSEDDRVQVHTAMEDLVVHLEESLELTPMEQGVKLVGAVLNAKQLNKWGVRNILWATWKEVGEMQVKWVKDNLYIIIVPDENSARQILSQVPWAVMKKNFSVKRWSQDLALEEIQWELVLFWVQIRGVPLCLSTSSNITRLATAIGQVEEVEDPSMARGFLRAKVLVDTTKPLITGCWLPRKQKQGTWIEFSYERLQDFCYRCGRIGHMNTDCSFEQHRGGGNGYGDWLKAAPIRDIIERPRLAQTNLSGRRTAGMKRLIESEGGWQRVGGMATPSSEANVVSMGGPTSIDAARTPSELQTWRQI
ncbi:hypothetical protein PS2_022246 [Malus domestica]